MFPCMINTVFPRFILNGAALLISVEVKYLGHFMIDDFRDDRDINRQCYKLYAQGNKHTDKKISCVHQMLKLAYLRLIVLRCMLTTYSGIIECIALENWMYHIILGDCYYVYLVIIARQLFANVNIPCFYAVIRNPMFTFITRLDK